MRNGLIWGEIFYLVKGMERAHRVARISFMGFLEARKNKVKKAKTAVL